MEDINKTLVVDYGDAMTIMDYNNDYCGCCKLKVYEEWYDKNEAYFIKKGVCLMDDLLRGYDGRKMRYCFVFDFEDQIESKFSVINYYNREKIAEFRYIRKDNDPYNPKVTVDYFNREAFDDFGYFINPVTSQKIQRLFEAFIKPYMSLPKEKYKQIIKKWNEKEVTILSEFMWQHTIDFMHSAMFYFTLQKPETISYEQLKREPESVEVKMQKKIVKYYYTGYVDLSKSKVYKVVVNKKLEQDKDKQKRIYQRHIEKWSVRGHYRNINGKKIWIDEHEKGDGTLEKRIYGVVPKSELNLMPKVFIRTVECHQESVKMMTEEVKTEVLPEISAKESPVGQESVKLAEEVPKLEVVVKTEVPEISAKPAKPSLWKRLIFFIKNIWK